MRRDNQPVLPTTAGSPASGRVPLVAPSWLASVVIHGLLLLLFSTTLQSCGRVISGESEGEFRQVGLVSRPSETVVEQPEQSEDAADARAEAQAADQAVAERVEQSPVPAQPPVPVQLPQVSLPTIGAGNAAPQPRAPGDVANLVKPSGTARPQALGLGKGETRFFGIRDQATRFAYVLDCSSSMDDYSALSMAKAELMASLQALERTQQFQIVFYNERPRTMTLRGEATAEFYWATDVNRTLAGNFVREVRAEGGTDHMPALKHALRMSPEVLFFLTDANDPQLTAGELNQLQQLSKGRTRVHTIEFGKGPQLAGPDNFLKKLAKQNGGAHWYVDVSQFGRR
jgi:Ca-activated chloride channel family protein